MKLLSFIIIFFTGLFTLSNHHAQEITKNQISRPSVSKQSLIKYTENLGQWDERVRFKAAVTGSTIFLEQDGFTFVVSNSEDLMEAHKAHISGMDNPDIPIRKHAFKMEFVNCNVVEPLGKDYYKAYENYFFGNNPDNWVKNIYPCKRVIYPNLWDNIDLHVLSDGPSMKYEFIVHPGGNYLDVRWRMLGLDSAYIQGNEFIYETSVGSIKDLAPVSYQWIDLQLQDVGTTYSLIGDTAHFIVSEYDHTKDLIIDPVLVAGTLVGATSFEELWGFCSSYGQQGDIYSATVPSTNNLPVSLGAFSESSAGSHDLGIMHFNPDGSELIWATYLGGSSNETPHKLWIDANEEVYVLGRSSSNNFPTTEEVISPTYLGLSDMVVCRLSPDGSELIASTYFGGYSGDGVIFPLDLGIGNSNNDLGEIITDENGDVLIAFSSLAIEYPHTLLGISNFSLQIVIAKLNSDFTEIEWCTSINGTGADQLGDMKILENGNIVVIGNSNSSDLFINSNGLQPTPVGLFEGFVIILNSNATQILHSTWYGKENNDMCFYVDEDLAGQIWICGMAENGMPIVGDVYANNVGYTYVTCISADLENVIYSTNIGTNDIENGVAFPTAFLIDYCGRAYVSAHKGGLLSGYFSGLEITTDAISSQGAFYLCVFEQNLSSLIYGTYFSGNHTDGGTSRFDKKGVVYQSICSCSGPYGNIEPVPWAYSTEQVGDCEASVLKLDFESPAVVSALTYQTTSNCLPYEVIFQNWSDPGTTFWSFGDEEGFSAIQENTVQHTYTQAGEYYVQLVTVDSSSCNVADTLTVLIHVPDIQSDLNVNFEFELTDPCSQNSAISATFTGTSADSIWWYINDISVSTGEILDYIFPQVGEYQIQLYASDSSCNYVESQVEIIHVGPALEASASILEPSSFCAPVNLELHYTGTQADSIAWYLNDQWISSFEEINLTASEAAEWSISVVAWNETSCNLTDTLTAVYNILPPSTLDLTWDIPWIDTCLNSLEFIASYTGTDADSLSWTYPSGTTYLDTLSFSITEPGIYSITLTAFDLECNVDQTLYEVIELVGTAEAFAMASEDSYCIPSTISLNGSTNGEDYYWVLPDGSLSYELSTSYLLDNSGSFEIWFVSELEGSCNGVDSAYIEITGFDPLSDVDWIIEELFDECSLPAEVQGVYTGFNETSLHWEDSNGNSSENSDVIFTYDMPGTYTIELEVVNEVCNQIELLQHTVEVPVSFYGPSDVVIPNIFSPNDDTLNALWKPQTIDTNILQWRLKIYSRWGDKVFESSDSNSGWDGNTILGKAPEGTYYYTLEYTNLCSLDFAQQRSGYFQLIR